MILTTCGRRLEPWLPQIFHLYWRFARGMTLGVRAVVLDADNRVFLVRHTYVTGWHLPGGGVEVGETFLEALRRELREEGRIELTGEPVLHGVFFNSHVSRRDHVAVYVVRQFRQDRLPEPNREIAECGFFARCLKTPGTRLRIAECSTASAARLAPRCVDGKPNQRYTGGSDPSAAGDGPRRPPDAIPPPDMTDLSLTILAETAERRPGDRAAA